MERKIAGDSVPLTAITGLCAVLGVRLIPILSHPRGQSPGGTQASGTGGRSEAVLVWTQVLGTGSCSPATAAACSFLLTLAWMCHGMRAGG